MRSRHFPSSSRTRPLRRRWPQGRRPNVFIARGADDEAELIKRIDTAPSSSTSAHHTSGASPSGDGSVPELEDLRSLAPGRTTSISTPRAATDPVSTRPRQRVRVAEHALRSFSPPPADPPHRSRGGGRGPGRATPAQLCSQTSASSAPARSAGPRDARSRASGWTCWRTRARRRRRRRPRLAPAPASRKHPAPRGCRSLHWHWHRTRASWAGASLDMNPTTI